MKRTLPYFIVGSFALVVYVLVFSVKKPSSKIQLAKEEAVLIQLENGILSEEFYDNGL
ncbi:hypothetical protein MMU07_03665 [Aquiflexum sp. LQ15W]|uniref:hypothetical protein n=1 Tax=Cognataquiflexum nitidum TaxID=2922272 RepID=UPI001F13407A|nr:hypothetical protein [Cognataquiflexum nitidum]MCH6198664.1 hypothetical protein [Cognataquiflexum nitidum]